MTLDIICVGVLSYIGRIAFHTHGTAIYLSNGATFDDKLDVAVMAS